MSVLDFFVEHFIKEHDQSDEQATRLLYQVMQANPVLFMRRCIETLNNYEELNKDYVRLLKLLLVVVGHVNHDMEGSKLAVIQATMLLKKSLQLFILLSLPNNQSKADLKQEVGQLLTDLHIKLMAICEDQVVNHISDFFESGKVPEVVILRIIGSMFKSACNIHNTYDKKKIILNNLHTNYFKKYYPPSHSLNPIKCEKCIENNVQLNLESVNNVSWLIFEQISKQWTDSKETNCQIVVLSLVGFMCQFIPKEKLEKNVERLNALYLTVIKKESKNSQLRPLFEGFNKFLDKLYCIDKIYYENAVKSVSVSLYEFYKNPIFSTNFPFDQSNLKYKNDLLSVLQTISQFNIDNCLDLFLGRINSKEQNERVACLWICNFLIGRNFNKISEPYKKQLVLQLLNLQFEQDCEVHNNQIINNQVRYAICDIIFQFCQKFKQYEISFNQTSVDMKALMFHLYSQVAIHDREIQEYGLVKSLPFDTTLEILKRRAQQILTILSNDLYYLDLLWPMTVEIINNQKFSPGLSHIFKSMTTLLNKAKAQDQSIIIPEMSPKPHVIIVRMLLLMQIPNFFENMGVEAVNFFPLFLQSVQIKFPNNHVYQQLDSMKQQLITHRELDEFYEEKVLFIWKQCLQVITQSTNMSQIEEDISIQLNTYIATPTLKSPVLKMHAILVSQLTNQEIIKFNLDRIFNICHTDYVSQSINLNIPTTDIEWSLRLCTAECFGYLGEKHTDIVLDKIKTIMNCEVIQKKQSGSLKDSVFQMFSKSTNQDENLASARATLIMALGCLAKRVDVKQSVSIYMSKLHEIIERNILPSLSAFLEKPHEQLQLSLQMALENVTKSIEIMLENGDEGSNHQFLTSFSRHRDQALLFSYRCFTKMKVFDQQFRTLRTISLLLKMSTTPLDYQKLLLHLNSHIELLYKSEPQVLEQEQVTQSFINLFSCFLGGVKLFNLKEESEQNVNTWEALLTLLGSFTQEPKYREGLLDVLQKSVQRQKLKIDSGDPKSLKFYFRVVLVLLKVIYQKTDARRQAVLILEKVILALNLYLDIFQKNEDEFNQNLIQQLSQKLQFSEVQNLVWEMALQLKELEIDESILGFISLLKEFYSHYQSHVNKDLDRFMQILITICQRSLGTPLQSKVQEQLGVILGLMVENNLFQTLTLMLEFKSEYPVNDFTCILLNEITRERQVLVKSFSFLTDIMNNPEDLISADVGNMIVNASLFIGQLLIVKNEVLEELIPKCLAQIFSTFILRFMTCFDPKIQSQSFGANASQSTIWAFQNFLMLSNRPLLQESVSQHVLKKMLSEDEVVDGIQEIAMIYCKSCTQEEMQQVNDFLLPFSTKKYDYFRLAVIIVIGQFIKQNNQIHSDKILKWQQTLLEFLLTFDNDDSDKVRAGVALGLGGVSYIYKQADQDTKELFEEDLLQRLCESLVGSLDDSSEQCIKCAMISLQNLVDYIPINVLNVFLPSLVVKTTSNFEKQQVQLRISAFSLFSKICRIFHKESLVNNVIVNILRSALVSLLLHLVDESVQVRLVCKMGLEDISAVLQDDTYRQLSTSSDDDLKLSLSNLGVIQDSLLETNEIIITVLVLTICKDKEYFSTFINTLLEFCKSPEYTIKGAAIYSLFIVLAFHEIDDLLKRKIDETLLEVNEYMLKWSTISMIMKGTYFLAQQSNKNQKVLKSSPSLAMEYI